MARKPPTPDEQAAIEAAAVLAIDQLWSRLMNSGLAEYASLQRQGVGAAEIARRVGDYLDGLSVKAEEVQARHVSTVAYNEGRAAALKDAAASGEINYVIRSELMDGETCASCAALDGAVVAVNSEDFAALKPPARCDGGDNCRGMYVGLGGGVLA